MQFNVIETDSAPKTELDVLGDRFEFSASIAENLAVRCEIFLAQLIGPPPKEINPPGTDKTPTARAKIPRLFNAHAELDSNLNRLALALNELEKL